jgi:8-oxo-dGTP diphosphatase
MGQIAKRVLSLFWPLLDLEREHGAKYWEDSKATGLQQGWPEPTKAGWIETDRTMAKSSKLIAVKRGRFLLVRRRRDHLWMFPGGQKRARESEKDCLRREIKEELPNLKLGRLKLWKEVKAKNRHSGRKMNDAIFVVSKISGDLAIGDKHEIDKAAWRKPRGVRLTPTSRYIRDMLSPKR